MTSVTRCDTRPLDTEARAWYDGGMNNEAPSVPSAPSAVAPAGSGPLARAWAAAAAGVPDLVPLAVLGFACGARPWGGWVGPLGVDGDWRADRELVERAAASGPWRAFELAPAGGWGSVPVVGGWSV